MSVHTKQVWYSDKDGSTHFNSEHEAKVHDAKIGARRVVFEHLTSECPEGRREGEFTDDVCDELARKLKRYFDSQQ